jgi:hypothetical protein
VGTAFSLTGEGSGGGMSVPSVREPNSRFNAGSSNFLTVVVVSVGAALAVLDGFVRGAMVRRTEISLCEG